MAKLKNERYERFANEYIIDFNATQAAKRAGYSPKTAYSQGQRLLKVAEIASRIAELSKKINEQAGISAKWVLDRAVRMHEVCSQEVIDEDKMVRLPDGQMVPLTKMVDATQANKALELVGKHREIQAWEDRKVVVHEERAADIEAALARKKESQGKHLH